MKRLEIRIDESDLIKLQAEAKVTGVAVSELVRQAIKLQNREETVEGLHDQMTTLLARMGVLL